MEVNFLRLIFFLEVLKALLIETQFYSPKCFPCFLLASPLHVSPFLCSVEQFVNYF